VLVADRPRHRANALRYWLLNKHGGVWVDVDVRPLRVIDEVIDDRAFVATLRGNAEGAVMGGPPGHKFFADLVAGLRPGSGSSSSVDLSGATYLQRHLQFHPDVRRCPPSMWFTYSASGRPILGDSYTEHLWASSRSVHAYE
jgi:hypothetical protein